MNRKGFTLLVMGFTRLNFELSEYKDSTGRGRKYLILNRILTAELSAVKLNQQ